MLAGAEIDAPFFRFDISGIDRAAKQDGHALIAQDPRAVSWKQRTVLKEAHLIRPSLEPRRDVAFKGFAIRELSRKMAASMPYLS